MKKVRIIECPRDAMQGIKDFIPTENKIKYINSLLKVGFDTIDFGSFVSAKAIPQMCDTAEVIEGIDLEGTSTKLLAIVANKRGAEDAVQYDKISYLGFPFSVSETFQQRNTNSGIEGALNRVDEIQEMCVSKGKQLVVYISMAFGNPYGDLWNSEVVTGWAHKLSTRGISIISLADTIGVSTPQTISYLFSALIPELSGVEIGAHLHTTPDAWNEKIHAAWLSGCRRFDGAIKGLGGCPMAEDKLTGNMPTEKILSYLEENKFEHGINKQAFIHSMNMAASIFPFH